MRVQPLPHCPTRSYRVYCLLGDGELSEGSVWEAMAFASINKLDNLVAILDINRLGQSDPTPLQHQMDVYQKRCEAFGWVRGSGRTPSQRGSHQAAASQAQGRQGGDASDLSPSFST